jgi:hypothetical protein
LPYTIYAAYLGPDSTDVDWFKVLLGAGQSFTVDMRPPAELNYNLELYKNNTLVGSGTLGTGQTEQVTYTNPANNNVTIYIKVFGVGGAYSASTPYYLRAYTVLL